MINSPSKQVQKKFENIFKNFEFSSLKKEFNFNLTPPSIQLLQSSNKKFFFEQDNFNNNINGNEINDIKGEKSIKQKLEDEFENLKPKKESFPIVFTVDNKFLDMLIDIYSNKDIIIEDNNSNIKKDISNESISNINNNNINIIQKNPFVNNNNSENKEQITCICLKSNCNNNYCSCHKNNNFCNDNCRCLNCQNKNEKDKISKIKEIKKTIGKNICRCKNTKCTSLYCECKKNSIQCSKNCLCVNCANI